jgi:DNA-binding protein H-NS
MVFAAHALLAHAYATKITINCWRLPLPLNLAEMSLKELKKLERELAAAIEGFDARSKAAAIAELEAHARQLGFSLAELTGAAVSVKSKRAPAAAKYRNPADETDTWSGRGRKPAWFIAALEAGTDLADLSI